MKCKVPETTSLLVVEEEHDEVGSGLLTLALNGSLPALRCIVSLAFIHLVAILVVRCYKHCNVFVQIILLSNVPKV